MMSTGNAQKPPAIVRSVSGQSGSAQFPSLRTTANIRLGYVGSGIDTGHTRGFAIDRPKGWNNYLFLRFRTPMEILTKSGFVTAEVGDCIVYPPGQPQWYCGRDVPFRDDWMHIDGILVSELLQQYNIPVGVIFTPSRSDFFPIQLSQLFSVKLRQGPYWHNEIEIVFQTFMLHLARALCPQTTTVVTDIAAKDLLSLQEARLAVHQDLQHKWTISEMAHMANIAPNRFSKWYRLVFKKSPNDDLIQARIEQASWLLQTSALSLEEISETCGFSDAYYFNRQFRKRLGITPGRFRTKNKI